MIVCVVGGKGTDKQDLVNRTLDQINQQDKIIKLITGAGHGTEIFARQWATARGLTPVVYKVPARERNLYAGHIQDITRNHRMVQEHNPDLVLVFSGSSVADTMIDVAKSNNIPYRYVTTGGLANPARTFAREPSGEHNHIAIVSDYVDITDIQAGGPLLGKHSILFEKLSTDAGIDLDKCLITSVFMEPSDKSSVTSNFIQPRSADLRGIKYNEQLMPLMWNYRKYYLKVGYETELSRLQIELLRWYPRVIITLGVCAMWALTGVSHLGKYHGKFLLNELTGYGYVLPTFSLGSITYDSNRVWYIKNILDKAKKSSIVKQPRALFQRYEPPY